MCPRVLCGEVVVMGKRSSRRPGDRGLGLLMMLGVPLGRLPGDFYVRRGNFSFYFPLATSIILSILLTLRAARCLHDDDHVHQSRHVDHAHGARAPDDRAVRRRPGARRRRSPTASRPTATTSASATSSRSSPTSTTRSSIRRTSIRSRSSTSRPTSASSRRTRSRWRSTIEYFRIPRDILTVCLGKSTYARCGIIVNVTPFEPEWEGHVTLEISNTTPLPAKIYANEGIAQVLFFQSDEPCEVSYKDKKGKYQAQRGVTLPKI